jgi:hypothetical protein
MNSTAALNNGENWLNYLSINTGANDEVNDQAIDVYDRRLDPFVRHFVMPVASGIDGIVDGATNLPKSAKNITVETFNGLQKDLTEKDWHQKAIAIRSSLAAVAVIGANAAHVRSIAVPMEMGIAREINPVVGGIVGGGLTWTWYMLYSHSIRRAARDLPNTLSAVSSHLPVDKAGKLPGLPPHSTEAPAEIIGRVKRTKERLKLRSGRIGGMQLTTTGAYVALGALQEQEDSDLSTLCSETSTEAGWVSFCKTAAVSGAVAGVGLLDKHLSNEIFHETQGVKGMVIFDVGSIAIMANYYKVKNKLRQRTSPLEAFNES